MIEIPIIFEDQDLVVVDKPSGIIVNRAQTVKVFTLQDWWSERYRDEIAKTGIVSDDEEYFLDRQGLVHRLDKETSGVMVLAKNVGAFVSLLAQFKERVVKKEYLALVHGIVDEHGIIEAPTGRQRHNRKLFGIREDGRETITEYKTLEHFGGTQFDPTLKVNERGYTGFSLVKFLPRTGRTHQIRVHAKHIGHPLVADLQYGGRKRSKEDRKWAPRVMLNAETLTLKHPRTEQEITFVSKNREIAEIAAQFLRK